MLASKTRSPLSASSCQLNSKGKPSIRLLFPCLKSFISQLFAKTFMIVTIFLQIDSTSIYAIGAGNISPRAFKMVIVGSSRKNTSVILRRGGIPSENYRLISFLSNLLQFLWISFSTIVFRYPSTVSSISASSRAYILS